MKVGVFGLGEAGSLIAADLAAKGIVTCAYDPANVETPAGVTRTSSPMDVVVDADFIISITAGVDAVTALQQALAGIAPHTGYADFSTNTAAAKLQLASIAASRGFSFTDVALMGTVPGKGILTPALASGEGAARFVEVFSGLTMPVTRISDRAGDAAARKLLRSIMMKGLASCVIEAMRGADEAGCTDWLWENIVEEISRADRELLARLVSGSKTHARRRLYEMQASAAMLTELGVEPVMTRATVATLEQLPQQVLPPIPGLPG